MKQQEQILANHLPDGIVVLNQQGDVIWFNNAAESLFELQSSNHKYLQQLLDDKNIFPDNIQALEQSLEITLNTTPKKYLALNIIPYPNQQILLVVRNITHIHHLERMRQDFVANVSHELRTPLTVIYGYLEMLIDQEEIQTDILQSIHTQMFQQSSRMQNLVENLLLLSRLEHREQESLAQQPVDITLLLQDICAEAKLVSGDKKHSIHLETDEELNLLGNKDELSSAFSNIIFNAVKYTPAGGDIYVKWFKQKDQALLEVKDSGIGIDAKHIPRLTERFYRVDKARSRESGGTGLGLAIVKHVLIRHKGHLNIHSQVDEGSTFTCVFALA